MSIDECCVSIGVCADHTYDTLVISRMKWRHTELAINKSHVQVGESTHTHLHIHIYTSTHTHPHSNIINPSETRDSLIPYTHLTI